ncbi:hypothetical protein [Entomobacter blattae]|uniref:DUF4209 domain-containing protein n=1 Tax=Entomobacter blattae TaxID=2762277 RepID=A0A7H1NS81_9PROT|nr:hypothetical protein [Entomobacter blattae]QNT78641.1 hypothetical protein JGUZn3_14160 [Entomobacter blattae]
MILKENIFLDNFKLIENLNKCLIYKEYLFCNTSNLKSDDNSLTKFFNNFYDFIKPLPEKKEEIEALCPDLDLKTELEDVVKYITEPIWKAIVYEALWIFTSRKEKTFINQSLMFYYEVISSASKSDDPENFVNISIPLHRLKPFLTKILKICHTFGAKNKSPERIYKFFLKEENLAFQKQFPHLIKLYGPLHLEYYDDIKIHDNNPQHSSKKEYAKYVGNFLLDCIPKWPGDNKENLYELIYCFYKESGNEKLTNSVLIKWILYLEQLSDEKQKNNDTDYGCFLRSALSLLKKITNKKNYPELQDIENRINNKLKNRARLNPDKAQKFSLEIPYLPMEKDLFSPNDFISSLKMLLIIFDKHIQPCIDTGNVPENILSKIAICKTSNASDQLYISPPQVNPLEKLNEKIQLQYIGSNVLRYVKLFKEEVKFSENDIRNLLVQLQIVNEEFITTYAKGIYHFLQSNFTEAIYILVPLLENHVVYLLSKHDKKTLTEKIKVGGATTLENISSLLEKNEEFFKNTLHWNNHYNVIKSIFFDTEYNLRNTVCHGLLPDAVVNNTGLLLGLYLFLQVIFLPELLTTN